MNQGEIWMLVFNAIMAAGTVASVAIARSALNGKQRVKLDQPLDVQLVEQFTNKQEFNGAQKMARKEFDDIWATVRFENTAIRREITAAVQHTQETLMEKLEDNRRELSNQITAMPDRVISTLKNTGAI